MPQKTKESRVPSTLSSTHPQMRTPISIIIIPQSAQKTQVIFGEITNNFSKCLCDMTVTEFEKAAAVISDKTIQNRARHAVYENKRTKDMVKALADKNYELCGKLLYESHYSLKDLYEVSCEEIDFLVEESKKIDGVIGARITGAGFGGCMVSIMKNDVIEDYKEIIGKAYKDKFNLDAEFYKVDIGSIKKGL